MERDQASKFMFDLLRLKLVEVDGAPQVEADPVAEMLEKGAVLVREGQYDVWSRWASIVQEPARGVLQGLAEAARAAG